MLQHADFNGFISTLEKLKCNTRHSWTSSGRQESVAEHSWRLAVMAMLLMDEFPDLDMDKVLKMCLIHDWGEAITGDIPSFTKNSADEDKESEAVTALLADLPESISGELGALFAEMHSRSTQEAKLWRALDMLEAVLQHNDADVSTWIPLEHGLQLTYGETECSEFDYLRKLRKLARQVSLEKLQP